MEKTGIRPNIKIIGCSVQQIFSQHLWIVLHFSEWVLNIFKNSLIPLRNILRYIVYFQYLIEIRQDDIKDDKRWDIKIILQRNSGCMMYASTRVIPECSQSDPRNIPNFGTQSWKISFPNFGTQSVPRVFQSVLDSRVIPGWSKSDIRVISEWCQSDYRVIPEWLLSDSRMFPEWSLCDHKVIPECSQSETERERVTSIASMG